MSAVQAVGKPRRDVAREAAGRESWWRLLYRDYRRYRVAGRSAAATVLLTQGFWASAVYRASRAFVAAAPQGALQTAARALAAAAQKLVEILTGICLPRECEIGPGLYLPSFGGIILSHGPIGENCTIEHGVTLGMAGRGEERGAPSIGDRVFIGAHSMIVGRISVGDDAVIFPGSIVTRSVPPRALVMGHPARVVSREGSFDWIAYDGMHSDPRRRAALEASD
ncbi:MAG TPA: serine acetyltransferase [Burkholderiales bacterium]